ncbi:MAG: hypothetical protein ChlgKO_02830 [Chlamydiales bacterium]
MQKANEDHRALIDEQKAANGQTTQKVVEAVREIIEEKGSNIQLDVKNGIIQAVEQLRSPGGLTTCSQEVNRA